MGYKSLLVAMILLQNEEKYFCSFLNNPLTFDICYVWSEEETEEAKLPA